MLALNVSESAIIICICVCVSLQDTEYHAVVKMPTHEFQKICRDMSQIGDSVLITCTKVCHKFGMSDKYSVV